MIDKRQRSSLLGCLLGGALGDALGAPVEGIRRLDTIRSKFGLKGVTDFIPYHSGHTRIEQTGIGAVTDDTTMALTTVAAMIMARNAPEQLHPYAWQGYLRWGARQEGGKSLVRFIDSSLTWPEEVRPFWFACGAGRGTLAALSTGRIGSPEAPLQYDATIRGKRTVGPNDGCGGMMRVAPLAFWPHRENKFGLGVEKNVAKTFF